MKVKPETFPISSKTRTKNVYFNNFSNPVIPNTFNQRPSSSNDLSFEGRFAFRESLSALAKKDVAEFEFDYIAQALGKYKETFGDSAYKKAEAVFKRLHEDGGKGVEVSKKEGKMRFVGKSVWENFLENAAAPFYQIPLDIGCFFINLAGKSRFKDSSAVRAMTGWGFFKNRTGALEHAANANALRGLVEAYKKNPDILFAKGHGRLDPLKSNYRSETERSLVRLTTGVTSAFFLANDAYNLSSVINDNPDMAKKDKKKRFNQELGRVGLTSYLTLFTLGSMSKTINKSPTNALIGVALSVLPAEILGRLIVGTPIFPVTAKQAKKIAEKRYDKEQSETQEKPAEKPAVSNLIQLTKPLPKPFAVFENNTTDINAAKLQEKHGSLGWKECLEILAGLTALGFGLKNVRKIKFVDVNLTKMQETFKGSPVYQMFQDFTHKEDSYTKGEIKAILDKLRKVSANPEDPDAGFNRLVEAYEAALPWTEDGGVDFGKVPKEWYRRTREFISVPFGFIHRNFIMGPADFLEMIYCSISPAKRRAKALLKFLKDEVKEFPFKMTDEESWQKIIELAEKAKMKFNNEVSEKIISDKIYEISDEQDGKKEKVLKNALRFIEKASDEDVEKLVSNQIFYAMSSSGKSDYSNAELGVSSKTVSSLIASLFLVADHYNLVMINSEGQDKKQAAEKAKERAIQRIVSVFYSQIVMKLNNSFLRELYNSSLSAVAAITISTQTIMEVLTRISIGMPVDESTKAEIEQTEQKNRDAKGLKGKYFKAMAYITGKKKLSDRQEK
ncbi:MAG: hypothetical protein PHC64_01000 [Candidatus Gastranaerophilales bacterium]|nr:hypothetical protein [Candidatus Gastranaerophilales bacterium]